MVYTTYGLKNRTTLVERLKTCTEVHIYTHKLYIIYRISFKYLLIHNSIMQYAWFIFLFYYALFTSFFILKHKHAPY